MLDVNCVCIAASGAPLVRSRRQCGLQLNVYSVSPTVS
jgi:hypothetical protein